MLFLISFTWLVAATISFILAILIPKWLTINVQENNLNVSVQRGIFYVCDLLLKTDNFETTNCTAMITQKSTTSASKWIYEYAIASSSLAIACAALSIITLWLSGLYFQVFHKSNKRLYCLCYLCVLVFIEFSSSLVVWILIVVETTRLGQSIKRDMFDWPMWLAVGATGGYLMSFVFMLISLCGIFGHRRSLKRNYYGETNRF